MIHWGGALTFPSPDTSSIESPGDTCDDGRFSWELFCDTKTFWLDFVQWKEAEKSQIFMVDTDRSYLNFICIIIVTSLIIIIVLHLCLLWKSF